MLKDITLGQYFPGDTAVHRLDPRTKILLVLVYIILISRSTVLQAAPCWQRLRLFASEFPEFLRNLY